MPTEKPSRDDHEWYNLGIAWEKVGDFKGAAEAYMRALQINPRYVDAWCNLGIVRHESGDFRAAIEAYEQALALNPEDASTWFNLGFARFALKDLKGATKACEQALIFSPQDAEILYTLACFRALSGVPNEALEYLRQAIVLEPKLREKAKQEPDFQSIRVFYEFQEMIEGRTGSQSQQQEKGSPVLAKLREVKQERKGSSMISKLRDAIARAENSVKTTLDSARNERGEQISTLTSEKSPAFAKLKPKEQVLSPTAENEPVVQRQTTKSFVRVKRQFEYIGGKVRIKINVANIYGQGLLRLSASLDHPQSFKLMRVEPAEYVRDGSAIKLGDLLPTEEKAAAWVLEPLICGKEKVGGTVSGVDANGIPFAVPMNPLEIEVHCPLFVRPEEANLPTIQRMQGDLPVHSERSFYLPEALAPQDAFELAKKVIAERDVRLVGTFTGETGQPYDRSAVFYGVTKVKQKRFVITTSVSEADRAIRIASACDEEDACTGLLAEAGASVRRELVSRGAVDTEEGVVELTCEKCGATLPRAPVLGKDVTCPECRWAWRASDFFR